MPRPLRPILLAALLLATAPSLAQSVQISAPADSLTLGDPFEVEVVVERPSSGQVIFPRPPAGSARVTAPLRAGDAELRDLRRLPPVLHPPDTQTDRAVYEAVVFEVDSAAVGPIEIRYVVGDDTTTLASNRVVVPVRSVVDPDAFELRPPAPPASFARSYWPWVLVAGVLLILLAAVAGGWMARRRSARARSDDPAALARWQLDKVGVRLPGPEDVVTPFYASLAEVVRTYIQDRTGHPALEITSRELLQALDSEPGDVPEEAIPKLRSLLETADLVKFADAVPPPERHPIALAEARAVIDLTETAILEREAALAASENQP